MEIRKLTEKEQENNPESILVIITESEKKYVSVSDAFDIYHSVYGILTEKGFQL